LSELAPALGVAAALIGLADMAPHVRDTVRPCTRPHRGTWLI
jgi:flagellar motor component MotA